MGISRRMFIGSGVATVGTLGALGPVVEGRSSNIRPSDKLKKNIAKLQRDPLGLLDLPEGFQYKTLSIENGNLYDGGLVPSYHDGMAAFSAGPNLTALIRNHEVTPGDVEKGLTPVEHIKGTVYDPEVLGGGTTTLIVDKDRNLIKDYVSLSGTMNNCAGGKTPWNTWLSCEEDDSILGKPHGYVFEVNPLAPSSPEPIKGMGRFAHEAVAFDRDGLAYLTEDSKNPHGCFYRFTPNVLFGGVGSLHKGGELEAMAVKDLEGLDLSAVQEQGLTLRVSWVLVDNPDPQEGETSVREQVVNKGATPIPKGEGTWLGNDGSIWFVSSRAHGPYSLESKNRSSGEHSGQIWKYDPYDQTIQLVSLIPTGSVFDEPDNITDGPHGFAIACTDSSKDQWLVGIDQDGELFPFGYNALNNREFAGATFSPSGDTLFVNLQGPPGTTFAIWGPWKDFR